MRGIDVDGRAAIVDGRGVVSGPATTVPESVQYHYPTENLSAGTWTESLQGEDLTGTFNVSTAFGSFDGMELGGDATNSNISVPEPITLVMTLQLQDQQGSGRREGFYRHEQSTSSPNWFGVAKGDFQETGGYPLQYYKGSNGDYPESDQFTPGSEFVFTVTFENSTITARSNGSQIYSFSHSGFTDQTSMEGIHLGESPEGEQGTNADYITELSVIPGNDLTNDDIEAEENRQLDKFGIS